jgi:hypothetical protein
VGPTLCCNEGLDIVIAGLRSQLLT